MKQRVFFLASILVVLLLLSIDLDRFPAPGWDEGWTMSAARNWVERGHYGQWQIAQPVPAGLAAAFPIVASVALSFKVFGVGIWQARVVMGLYTIGCLGLLYFLARKLYDRGVARAAILLLIFFMPDPSLQPIMQGRQVLGEIPMMFYLLLGYLGLWYALTRSSGWLLFVIPIWGVALIAKTETLPFWCAAMMLPIFKMLISKQRRAAIVLMAAWLGALALWWLGPRLIDGLIPGYSAGDVLTGLYEVTAVVLIPQVRWSVLILIAQIGLPTVAGLTYMLFKFLRGRESAALNVDILRWSLWSLAASWFTWYALLSRGTTRYAFPAIFIGSLCVAILLRDVTDDYQFGAQLKRLAGSIRARKIDRRAVAALTLVALLLAMAVSGLIWIIPSVALAASGDQPVQSVSEYLNTHTAPDALIETYDSELFVLLNRRYHFPLDQISVDLIRDVTAKNFNVTSSNPIVILYDPLVARPDYIVVGPDNELWRRLYDPILSSGAFRKVYSNSTYEVYQRLP